MIYLNAPLLIDDDDMFDTNFCLHTEHVRW